jgi:hypothetical protein
MTTQYPSLREQIAVGVVELIREITQPQCALVTREPFEVEKIAITQFPAVLVQMTNEERTTITMGANSAGRRMGTIVYEIRGFVRGTELDSRRNELITAIETKLDTDRYLGMSSQGVTDSQLIKIEIINRLPPLAEILITFEVKYNYVRGSA